MRALDLGLINFMLSNGRENIYRIKPQLMVYKHAYYFVNKMLLLDSVNCL